MKPFWFLLTLSLCLAACSFDESRQRDLALPATLAILNHSGEKLSHILLTSTPESQGGFSLTSDNISANEKQSMKITASAFDDLKDRNFQLRTQCGSNKNWNSIKENTKLVSSETDQDWSIRLTVLSCQDE